MNKSSEHKYVVDGLDTPVSTTEPTPDTTDQAVTPPAMASLVYSPILWFSYFSVPETRYLIENPAYLIV